MVQSESWLLRGLLGLICLLPLCISAAPDLCGPLKTVRENINATQRRRFMKNNFPINYTIQVYYEEVFRVRNISRLMNMSTEDEPVLMSDLQDLWLAVCQQGIKKVLKVLPERHPTRRKYLFNLENLFRKFEEVYNQVKDGQREYPEIINDIWARLNDQDYQGWKPVTPKSILDNCYRTMPCLFKNCFTTEDDSYDYCEGLNRRKEKKTT